ncbi:uncharacterized protein LOC126999553 [Eriocheir sinensis]|uniref:uncharacterized protein LOC126999553 n=1 Tax=Eriocheir sinensis TaxID=95602 RepID=UPI0021CAB2B7|nr:uncharacterized protein LOC126999553 [Eriocheir sinensis]XP_050718252.1 uncharacterized protein LOC126999553 [Eriocheir sinensis]XP_050718253.1 uncharacterized protein LOC126999553 [Eriocheir sinensis]XP_050718254.1 uncharacterized protein LOC126999553 [Eriocheir sinensis]XP_050718255.1 uncharacterized protein LOC126999553 [Eriocheir sinensis]
MPPENTTLFFHALEWRRSGEEGHNISIVTPPVTEPRSGDEEGDNVNRVTPTVIEPNIRLGDDVAESELVLEEFEHPGKTNITSTSPGELNEGTRERLKSGSVGSPSVSHPSTGSVRVGPRGSNVLWGSEDGVVHIRRLPRHKSKKHQAVMEDDDSLTHEEMIGTEELSPHVHSNTTTHVTTHTQGTGDPSTQEEIIVTQETEELSPHIHNTTTHVTTHTQGTGEMIATQETKELSPHTHNTTTHVITHTQATEDPAQEQTYEGRLLVNTEGTADTPTQRFEEITNTDEKQEIPTLVPDVWVTERPRGNTDEAENPATQPHGENIINTDIIEDIPSLASDVWVTDSPATEDWLTDTPEEEKDIEEGLIRSENAPEVRLTSNEDDLRRDGPQGWQTVTYEESSTEGFDKSAANVYPGSEWSTVSPDEQLTSLPEDWLTSTPHPEDDWLMTIPQDDEQVTDLHERLPSLPSILPSLSPTPSIHTPTAPPSLPPTPSPQDTVEDSLRITTRGLDFLLEASPTGQSSVDATEFPKDDLFTLDLTITTTREGLNADARDVTFDPSQIAKATSYEGSSYPTATRSATVTTTWVDNDQFATLEHQNLTLNEELVRPSAVGDLSDLSTELRGHGQGSEDVEMSTPEVNEEFAMPQLNGLSEGTYEGSDSHGRSDSLSQTHPSIPEVRDGDTTTPSSLTETQNENSTESPIQNGDSTEREKQNEDSTDFHERLPSLPSEDSTETQKQDEDSTEQPGTTFEYSIHQNHVNTSGVRLAGHPNLNLTGVRSESTAKGSANKTEEAVMYEIPVVIRNHGQALTPSMVVALSVCCAVVMVLAALSVALWVCRRHRNRSKIYLSREAAKPRALFTRPMNPAVLPEESDHENATVYMLEFQRPRPPIMLGDDQKGIYFIKRDEGETEECRLGLGVENGAFTDVPLGDGDQGRPRLDPPKYDLTSKQDGDADSGIRVWSSTGSLHAASSPLPTHCRVPPPPYSPSISKESVCLSVHSLPSLPRNSQLFDV